MNDTLHIRSYQPADEEEVIRIWDQCGLIVTWNNPHADIRRKIEHQPDLLLVACRGETVIGSVMAGYDGHRGWINYLGVLPAYQGQGIGRRLITENYHGGQ